MGNAREHVCEYTTGLHHASQGSSQRTWNQWSRKLSRKKDNFEHVLQSQDRGSKTPLHPSGSAKASLIKPNLARAKAGAATATLRIDFLPKRTY
mmetsp:Transcript_1691/g.3202  ORF Transcript_1691/g.3202 Transcript_1691/m.3202 type:complete len:94 (+) Transcript_1691:616-897(+)